MFYSKLQKFLSSLLIFFIFFSITFRIPFLDFKIFAGSNDFFNLVSIIVDEESYSEIKGELERYSKDIQGVLENTKVIILPTPKDTSAFNIASMNEALYYEGYKSLDLSVDFKSKLIGTVLVGDFNLPIVYDKDNSAKTILPFTDFEDKVYIFNNEVNRYEKNKDNINGLKSEIWHGVISPNFGDFNSNIKGLKDYFDKNHDFYSGTGNFKFSEGVLNGKKNIGVPSIHKPFVFYYDQFREEKALNYNSFKGYEGYIENKEDIVYKRYSKKLADKLSDKVSENGEKVISELLSNINADEISSVLGNKPDVSNSPDIQTRHIIDNVTKTFIEVFAKGTLGDFRKNVYNAGRYNEIGSEVNVDIIPYLVTVLDLVNDEIIKDVNDELEKEIDDLVKNGLSRNIAVPAGVTLEGGEISCVSKYDNFLYGTQVNNITNASQCSIFKGSNDFGGQLVEQNRGYNFALAGKDASFFGSALYQCSGGEKALNGYFGGNTPVNINTDSAVTGDIKLNSKNYKNAILPIFDISSAKIIKEDSFINSPLNCFDNNLLLTKQSAINLFDEVPFCEEVYSAPVNGQSPNNFVCSANNQKLNFNDTFDSFYKNNPEVVSNNILCGDSTGYISNAQNFSIIKTKSGYDTDGLICNIISKGIYDFKFISSYITHKSPTVNELKAQIKSLISPNLAIDKNRYIDFISAKGEYESIYYPTLFRLDLENTRNLTFEKVSSELEKILNQKSKEINDKINEHNPSVLGGKDREIFNLLKVGNYPSANIDLLKTLKEKEDKAFTVGGEEKTLSYYDTLVFSIYWNSLTSVSGKYGFIMDQYLVDQFGKEDQKYFLPKNKKMYEVAYLGAEGDAQNMYIKMDPEGKADNPYSDIIGENIKLGSYLMGSNIGSSNNEEGVFKCAPPDGVPIFEWIPAIMCWLGEMMPPSISLSEGTCGPSLLSVDEQEEIRQCKGDVDKNGINDCIETKLKDGVLELSSDSAKYYYNKNALLKATIKDKNGKTVKIDNSTDVYFEVVKVEKAKDSSKEITEINVKTVYNIDDVYLNKKDILSDYVSFKDGKVKSSGGISNYGITLKSKDINVYLKSYIKIDNYLGNETIFMESNVLKLEVRGDRLFNTSYKLINSIDGLDIENGATGIKVSDKTNIFIIDGYKKDIKDVSKIISNSTTSKEKIVLSISNIAKGGFKTALSYPLNIKLLNDGKEISNTKIKTNELNLFKPLFNLEKSGSYSLEITDSVGFKTIKNIELLSESPDSIDIQVGTTIMESGGNISTNFITIYDRYLNPTIGEFLDIEFSIDGESLEFLDNNSKKLNSSTFEGYKIFRLKSTGNIGNNKINISIFDSEGKELIKNNKEIKVLKNIDLRVNSLSNNVKVGGNTYKYNISLRDEDGNIISDFDSRVYLIANPIYLESNNPYVELKNGVAEIEFRTKTVAGKNIDLEFQVEGLNKIAQEQITIFPDDAMKIDLVLSQSKIEASSLSNSNLSIELKDRYNNLVFNDNTTKTSLEILDKYKHIIESDKYEDIVSEGKALYKIRGTMNPGIAYFKISTNPSLSINSFNIEDEKGNVIVNGVGENVGKIETYYFWNDDKLKGKKYNALYTTLLGSNYGDITQQDYLAGSLLFEKENRSLAVTSLLNNSYKYSNVLNLSKEGSIKKVYSENNLLQDIEITTSFIDNKIALNLFNKSLNTYIGKVFYNFGDDTKLSICESEENNCINNEKTSIFIKTVSDKYSVYLNDDKLLLRDIYGKNLLEILPDGTINRYGNIDFKINEKTENNLSISIQIGGKEIAILGYNFIDAKINLSREEVLFNQKINSIKNSILILLNTNSYSIYSSGNKGEEDITFYYNDPFSSDFSLDTFTKSNTSGIENFPKKGAIGWEDGNKSLLSFSAGKSVGESVSDYMSFSVINLGDPVISLKKIKKKIYDTNDNRKFDSTIGKLLSKDEDIVNYNVFDYNNDSKADILLIKKDKYLKLLENKDIQGDFLDKGNLAYITDLGNIDLVKTGDFTGDGYDDIFFVNKKGFPYLLNNVDKDFNRYSLINEFYLDGRIVRAQSFDMDNDGVDDIVTLDDSGEINIFYGGNDSVKPTFTKLTVSKDNGIKLNEEIRNDNALIYFEGLYQPLETVGDYSDSLSLNRKIGETDFEYKKRLTNVITSNKKLDDSIFIKYPYSPSSINSNINYENILNGIQEIPLEKDSKYFLKSEYSEFSGLKVEKIFKDANGGFVSSGDIINVEIILTNVSDKKINNIVYSEKIPNVFDLDKKSIITKEGLKISDAYMGYNFLVDGINLNANEKVSIGYKATVKPIKYSHIDVGLFEKGNIGDDLYGDIILKDDNKNCSATVDIFTSSNSRTYSKGTKTPTCDENKIKLPESVEKNTFDANNNGVPDYIDTLTNTNNTDALKEYADEELNKMSIDSDNDGIPDNEDLFDMEESIIFDLGESGKKIDKALDNVQDIMNGLSCGFGNASCFASPLNWAPLAPGNDPVFMGKTIGDGLKVDEGIPIVSGLTGINIPTPTGCFQVPAVWPASPFKFTGSCNYDIQAGGALGTDSPTNFFRLFVTPTLTGGVGTAICFGGPASIIGNSVPEGLSPLVPGGNCIVVAQQMPGCKGGGVDGDPSSIGIPLYSGNGSFGIINGNCSEDELKEKMLSATQVGEYLGSAKKGPVEKAFEFLPGNFSETPKGYFSKGGADISVILDLDSIEEGNFDDIIQIQQKRISPFPSWLMGWVTRQVEEIANKLTDFPTIFVVLPDFTGVFEIPGDAQIEPVTIDNNIGSFEGAKKATKKVSSGIKEVYEFIGSTPLVNIRQEVVNISLPIISEAELNSVISNRTNTLKQWESEINRAKKDWADLDDNVSLNLFTDLDKLIFSLRENLEIIKEYKKIPEDINNLLNKKEDYLEQILCNVEIISGTLSGWIGKNGERFKSWVELYILIKATLKSWQLLIDVFIGYEEECYECKNERGNALDWQFSLIDILIPDIPIIKFPKWPDIYMDLHNIRAGLNVYLPQFDITSKPILLPSLPNLYLPDAPNVLINLKIDLPTLPILTRIEIPTLPDLPTLPMVNLPDLPPPPKLPKMFSEIEVVLDIAKLITKAMCILKSSPFHPEWRAGDQIAFLTERNGYLWTDFFSISSPQFSFPFVDAIKVTSYVNFEFESEFIVELARQIALPLNSFSNDLTNMLYIPSNSLDLRNAIPKSMDVNIDKDGVNIQSSTNDLKKLLIERGVENISHFASVLENGQKELVDNKEFLKLINNSLASKSITSNPKMDKIRGVWEEVNNITYSKENALIKELQDTNRKKFDTLSDIINTEIIKNKNFKEKINSSGKIPFITEVSYDSGSDIKLYNEKLAVYNEKFINSAKKLISGKPDYYKEDLKEAGKELLTNLTPLQKYSSLNNNKSNNLVSAITTNTGPNTNPAVNSCQIQANSDTRYDYKGLYIIEGEHSYNLFDYNNELDGNETTSIIDIDNDLDEDLLYFANNSLYLKVNQENKPTKAYVTTPPIVLNSDDNKFFNGDVFIESINGASEKGNDIGSINIGFFAPTDNTINNFRIGLYKIVDKYLNEKNSNYRPEFIKKEIIDGIVGVGDVNKVDENELFIKRKNIAFINNIGNFKGVKLITKKLTNIKDNIILNQSVNILKGTVLYAGGDSFTINYIVNDNPNNIEKLILEKYENIEFLQDVKIVGISGNAYIKGDDDVIYEGVQVRQHLEKPLFFESKILYNGNKFEVQENSYVEIVYYDKSELSIDFNYTDSWELYDLGNKSSEYFLRISRDNDYYYSKVNSFKNNINSTLSKQILLAPQLESDVYSPELSIPIIRVPVYQNKIVDLTGYVYEDSGIENINEVYIDFNLDLDTDNNGNFKDDNDGVLNGEYKNKVKVLTNNNTLKLDLGPFDTIFKKKVGITMIDKNGNIGYEEVEFEVYSPIPKINNYNNGLIEGTIDENLSEEPIDIYRFRGGVITKIKDDTGVNKSLTIDGNYLFNVTSEGKGLVLYKDSKEVAFINELTGKIDFKDFSLQTRVLSSNNISNDGAFPKIFIESNGADIFYQSIKVEGVDKVDIVSDFENIKDKGIYFSFTDRTSYNYYVVPETLDYNPGSLSIYRMTDLNKENLFTIFNDGRINTINPNYKLEYDSYKDYVVLKLIDSHFNREVGRVLFLVDSSYVMK